MEMDAKSRDLGKIYKRRDRYEIPDWQRTKVWNVKKQQLLIDSILRGWHLPKFYFVELGDETFEVVDGQQRLNAIFSFLDNELPLNDESAAEFGATYYKDLDPKTSDAFDDFEIQYDVLSDVDEPTRKAFFLRLQLGLQLTTSEKLNAEHSKLRDFCKQLAKHPFFTTSVAVLDTRFAHFDIASKVAITEINGVDTGLRFDDIKPVFDSHSNFSPNSAVAKRLRSAFDFLAKAFPKRDTALKNRTFVQSVATLACRLVATGKQKNLEKPFAAFIHAFMAELAVQIEKGQSATDFDYLRFQKSINANVKAGAKTRHEILLRKLFVADPKLAQAFDSAVLLESGIVGRVSELSDLIASHINVLNTSYGAIHGEDLFKATNKTAVAQSTIRKPVKTLADYKSLVESLYFLFKESTGSRLSEEQVPQSFKDVNLLRTDLQHDVDHGKTSKVKKKKTDIGDTFKKFGGDTSPEALAPERFILVQANLLTALEHDLAALPVPK